MNAADPLAALRDIHAPPPPGFWPPAPGLIAAACIVLVAGTAAAIAAARWWRAGRPRREALARLRHLRRLHRAGVSETEIAMELSTLMRRVALARGSREELAGLTGSQWIEWIESTPRARGVTLDSTVRDALLVAPYARRCRFDTAHALSVCERWIRRG